MLDKSGIICYADRLREKKALALTFQYLKQCERDVVLEQVVIGQTAVALNLSALFSKGRRSEGGICLFCCTYTERKRGKGLKLKNGKIQAKY